MQSAIYSGTVTHRRFFPKANRFAYGIYQLWIDIDELPTLERSMRSFGWNRWAPFAFHDRDHGPRDGSPLRPWFEGYLREAGINLEGGAIRILALPRVFGYVFNPISVWCGYGPEGDLRAVLYEVANTFGGAHSYLFASGTPDEQGAITHVFDKELFVSPFIPMDATYEFKMRPPGERAGLTVREFIPQGHVLTATFTARRTALTQRGLWQAFAAHPAVTLKVIGAIHVEAVRLLVKRAPFRRHLPPPAHDVTVRRATTVDTPAHIGGGTR